MLSLGYKPPLKYVLQHILATITQQVLIEGKNDEIDGFKHHHMGLFHKKTLAVLGTIPLFSRELFERSLWNSAASSLECQVAEQRAGPALALHRKKD